MDQTASGGAPPAPWKASLPPSRWRQREADHADRGECITCGSSWRIARFEVDGYRYVTCGSCGLVRLFPRPDPTAIETLYDSTYFEEGEGGGYAGYDADATLHSRNARDRLALVERWAPATGSRARVLLDVGCGTGYVLLDARRRGWSVHGVDISEWARQRARAAGLRTFGSLRESMDELCARADVVTFFQSLEHLTRPDEALRQAHELLRPGGMVVIETWDLDSRVARLFGRHWQQVTPPSVVYLFSRRTLAALLAHNGFNVLHVRATSKVVSVGLVLAILAGKYSVLRPVERLARRIGLASRSIHYRLGDLMTVVAQRDPASGPTA